ncbi:MAG TPA: hypothetical protein VK067_07490 [Pseudogracilibacillus sp.]|nr:hypothetical protein [Pseudogracilibacillus sp.]
MRKRNAYGAMFMSFMAGMALLSGSEYSVLICLISLIVTVFVANNWGLNTEEDEPVNDYEFENEQVSGNRDVV